MERHVKERLIGAAVLVAAAVILIPEMLSGPRSRGGDVPVPVDGQAPLKTYTIDLSKSPATQAAAAGAAVDERAPPAESSAMPSAAESAPTAPAAQATAESDRAASEPSTSSATPPLSGPQVADKGPEKNTNSGSPAPAQASRTSEPPAPQTSRAAESATAVVKNEPKPAPAQRTPSMTSAPPAATATSGRASGGWAVQVASFTTDATAQKVAKDLRAKGQDAFVMPFKSGGATRYRVRIGPMPDREAAAAALQRVKSLAPGAVVVAHP